MSDIDLHVHSNVSDGSMSPREVAAHAKERGLRAFALTDHECAYGSEEAWEAARELGLGYLPGIEISVRYRDGKLHIICLGYDAEHPAFREMHRRLRAHKEARIPDVVAYVRDKGIDIDMERVEPYRLGRPLDLYAVMRYLVTLHLCEGAQPLWDKYLNPAKRDLGLDDLALEPGDVLPAIHAAGGVTSLAHYHKGIGLKRFSREEQEAAIAELHGMGLDGMERWYPNYSAEDAAFAAAMIEKYGLLATAGTDFHGSNRPGVELGTGIDGNLDIPFRMFEEIARRVKCCTMPEG